MVSFGNFWALIKNYACLKTSAQIFLDNLIEELLPVTRGALKNMNIRLGLQYEAK